MRECDIIFETNRAWVFHNKKHNKKQGAYVVFRINITHSISDSAYAMTEDGKSLAVARAQYLSR